MESSLPCVLFGESWIMGLLMVWGFQHLILCRLRSMILCQFMSTMLGHMCFT